MTAVLQGSFTDRPRDAAWVFRAALDALARPGRTHVLAGVAPPAGLSPAAGALLLVLADADTPLWLPEALRQGAAAEWLRFHTNAPQVAERHSAVLGVGAWDDLSPLEDWPPGKPAYPDLSATLIVEVPALEGGAPLELRGPGIHGRAHLAPVLPDGAAKELRANAARFPLGLDFFFTAEHRIAGLPRSTRIGG